MIKQLQRGDKKLIRSWAMYDWANSVYSLVITSAVFPIYYDSVTPMQIHAFGRVYMRSALYSYSLSFAFLVIAFISPLLSSIKGNTGKPYNGPENYFEAFPAKLENKIEAFPVPIPLFLLPFICLYIASFIYFYILPL